MIEPEFHLYLIGVENKQYLFCTTEVWMSKVKEEVSNLLTISPGSVIITAEYIPPSAESDKLFELPAANVASTCKCGGKCQSEKSKVQEWIDANGTMCLRP